MKVIKLKLSIRLDKDFVIYVSPVSCLSFSTQVECSSKYHRTYISKERTIDFFEIKEHLTCVVELNSVVQIIFIYLPLKLFTSSVLLFNSSFKMKEFLYCNLRS